MEQIQPFGDRVLVKVIEPEKQSAGGIIMTSATKETSNRGEVVAVGEGTTLSDGTVKPLQIATGDTVVFVQGAGTTIKTAKEDYKLLSAKEILCKILKG